MHTSAGKAARVLRVGVRCKILITAVVAAVFTIALATTIIHQSYERFNQARWNVIDLQAYRLVLEAMTNIVAERGPSNCVMAEKPSLTSPSQLLLAEYRTKTDRSLEGLTALTKSKSHSPNIPAALILSVREKLSTARGQVDAAAATPTRELRYAQIQNAINAMIEAAEIGDMVIQRNANSLILKDRDLTLPVLTGLILSHLRDYAGRIASHIIAPIAVHEKIPFQSLVDSQLARGRVLELWQIIDLKTTSFSQYRDVLEKRDAFEKVFFGHGLSLVDNAINESGTDKAYTFDTIQFSNEYVKTIRPLEELRAAFLNAMISDYEEKEGAAKRILTLVCVASLIILVGLIGIVYWVQVHLLHPLLQASGAVVDLAEGRPLVSGNDKPEAREVRRLFDAITVLNERMNERAALMLKLKSQATIDGLTGLLNRRAIDRLGERACEAGQICLVLLDIDHFKAINDSFGHPVGDEVIKVVARLLEDHTRPADRPARFGGEEFAVLIDGTLKDAIAVACRLRLAVSKTVVTTATGEAVRFTSSFGVAASEGGAWPALVSKTDAALYRAKREGRNRVRFEQNVEPVASKTS